MATKSLSMAGRSYIAMSIALSVDPDGWWQADFILRIGDQPARILPAIHGLKRRCTTEQRNEIRAHTHQLLDLLLSTALEVEPF